MKKVVIALALCVCFLTGCGSKTETLVCTRTASQNGMDLNFRYEVEYKGKTVAKVHTVEKIKSNAPQTLDEYKKLIEATFSTYKKIKYYESNVSIKGDTLTSTTDINYSKIDTDALIKIDSANEKIIKKGKVNVDDLKATYEAMGTTCKVK